MSLVAHEDHGTAPPVRPAVFVSHASDRLPEVRGLVASLVRDGCDCWFDEVRDSGEDWPTWMTRGLREADHVLCVVTPRYHERFRGEAPEEEGHGVAWEAGLIRKQLYARKLVTAKFAPVLLESALRAEIPVELLGCTYFDLAGPSGYERLLRHLHGVPGVVLPRPGSAPVLEPGRCEPAFARPRGAAPDGPAESALEAFPIGPIVRAHELPVEVVDLFARQFEGRSRQAQACLASAMAARGSANPEGFTDLQIRVSPADLPDPQQGLRDYWISALLIAGQKSRRTLAALLLDPAAPQPWQASEAEALALVRFLDWLRTPES